MSKAVSEKNDKLRKAAVHFRLLVTGIAVTGGCGFLMLTDSAFNPAQRPDKSAVVKASADTEDKTDAKAAELEKATASAMAVVKQEFLSGLELGEPRVKKMTFPKFKKAAIGDYDMSASETRSKNFKSGSSEITDPNDFTVPFPEQNTLIYYPEKRAPQNLTTTRSVAEEYFKVYDENSGRTLVLNGHELLCLIVNNEIGDSWGEEAIKAQIVAAYSYLRYNQEHGFTPTVGLRYNYSTKLERCVNAVEGQAMHYNGSIINAVYSASSAGYTTTAKDIWGGYDLPYLKCVESIYDSQDVNWGYTKKLSKAEVKALLEDRFDIELSDDHTQWITVNRAYSVVYIDSVTIDGRPECRLTGNQLCNLIGLKSNAITIKYKDGIFTFTSCGWGHGVGMSQWGAHYYAKNGWTYDQILTHYYVDATLAISKPAESYVETPNVSGDGDSSGDYDGTDYTEPDTTVTTAPEYDEPQFGESEDWTETTAPEEWQPEPETPVTTDTDYGQEEAPDMEDDYGQDDLG